MASAVTTELSDILERLKQCGLRMTRNRQKLVEVLMESGRPLSADEIMAFCVGKLARFKLPKTVKFIDIIPRNPSGKALKRELRTQFPRKATE